MAESRDASDVIGMVRHVDMSEERNSRREASGCSTSELSVPSQVCSLMVTLLCCHLLNTLPRQTRGYAKPKLPFLPASVTPNAPSPASLSGRHCVIREIAEPISL
jgi:hypothetical protein